VGRVRVSESHSDSISEIPHQMRIDIAIALSSRNLASHARISRRR
jgi:transcriptional regulator GlxA family with amidase domain